MAPPRQAMFPLPACLKKPLRASQAQALGISLEPLEACRTALRRAVDEKRIVCGYATLCVYRGTLIHEDSYGFGDPEACEVPVDADTIMRIFSATKSWTALAILALYEDGLLGLDDPVDKYIPGWKDMRVAHHPMVQHGSAQDPPARCRVTIRHLLTHTSGLGYGRHFTDSPKGAAEKSYNDLLGRVDDGTFESLGEFVDGLGMLPLRFHPGERYWYSFGFDVAARIAEVVSGEPYATFLKKRILDPLRMHDTSFHVTPAKQGRLSGVFERGSEPGTVRCLEPAGAQSAWVSSTPPACCAAGGVLGGNHSRGRGLVSTARDAMRLGLLLRNQGVCFETGERLFKASSIRMLLRNWLPLAKVTGVPHVKKTFAQGPGIGVSPLGQVGVPHPRRKKVDTNVGEVGFGGWACTYWGYDPTLDLVMVWFSQQPDMKDWSDEEDLWKAARRAICGIAPIFLPLSQPPARTETSAEVTAPSREKRRRRAECELRASSTKRQCRRRSQASPSASARIAVS